MTKYIILFTACLLLHNEARAEAGYDFEAELKLLEKNEMAAENRENQQMKAVEELSVEEDSISLKQSATKKPLPAPLNQESLAAPIKGRRIRSR